MNTNYLDMLNKLKFNSSVGDRQKISTADPNILVTYNQHFAEKNPDYEIRVRLLFDTARGDPNPYCRHWHNFKSAKDGSWVHVNCTNGRCPICNATYTVWNSGDKLAQDRLKSDRFMRSDTYYMNCYVISNPVEPSQNGTVKIIKMNKPILDVYKRATTGRDAKRFGNNIFRLDSSGNTFVITVKDVRSGMQRYPQFTDTYFEDSEECADDVANLTDSRINDIYASTFDLSGYFVPSTQDEAKAVVAQHIVPAFEDILGSNTDSRPVQRSVPQARAVETVAETTAVAKNVVDTDDGEFEMDVEDSVQEKKSEPLPTRNPPTPDNIVTNILADYGIDM